MFFKGRHFLIENYLKNSIKNLFIPIFYKFFNFNIKLMKNLKNDDIFSPNFQNNIKDKLPKEKKPIKISKEDESQKKKSYLKENKLLIILLSILICAIILSLVLSIIFTNKKKNDSSVIVEIKREINQIDYYYSSKKQIINYENLKSSKENLRNLEDETITNSKLEITNSLLSINTFDIIKDKKGRDIYKSFIIINELNYTNENENNKKLISLNLEEIEEETNIIPLIEVEFYKNGTIINEYIPNNLNESYLEILEYSKEKLIPLVSESLYKKDNLRTLSENSEEELSYEENKKEHFSILKKKVNKKVLDNGNEIKNSLNKGNMVTTIINGTIQTIELNASIILLSNDTKEKSKENNDTVYVKFPYQKISSDVNEKLTFIKSDYNENIINKIKNSIKKFPLLNKNSLKKEKEEEENKLRNLNENKKLRKLSSNTLFKDIINEKELLGTSFLGQDIKTFIRTETDLNSGNIINSLIFQYGSLEKILKKDKRKINVNETENKIINSAIGYKKEVQKYEDKFIKLLKKLDNTINPLYRNINNKIIEFNQKDFKYFEAIEEFEKGNLSEEDLIKFYNENKLEEVLKEIISIESVKNDIYKIRTFVNSVKTNIENYFNQINPSIPNLLDPLSEFNKLNEDSDKIISSIVSQAEKYFGGNRNLRNLQKEINENKNIDKELLRGLTENTFVSGNPIINSILQDFDKMSYGYYLFVYNLSKNPNRNSINNLRTNLNQTIFSGLLTKNYRMGKNLRVLSDENKEQITKIYSDVNLAFDQIVTISNKITSDTSELDETTNEIKNIYNNTLPMIKINTYDSLISKWEDLLNNSPSKVLINFNLERLKQNNLFEKTIGCFGFNFKLEGSLNLDYKIQIQLMIEPKNHSISLYTDLLSNISISIGGSITAIVIGGGAEAYVALNDLHLIFQPTLNLLDYNNNIYFKISFNVPQLGFKAYYKELLPTIECGKILIIEICLPDLQYKKIYLVDEKTDTYKYEKSWGNLIEIDDKKEERKSIELINFDLLKDKGSWIIEYFN